MSQDLAQPIHWQGRQWAVTAYGIEALDGIYHVPFSEISPADDGPAPSLEALRRRYGTDRNDLDAALRVARRILTDAAPTIM